MSNKKMGEKPGKAPNLGEGPPQQELAQDGGGLNSL
jgi:hypothetical protein